MKGFIAVRIFRKNGCLHIRNSKEKTETLCKILLIHSFQRFRFFEDLKWWKNHKYKCEDCFNLFVTSEILES
jgi:hypothetical protein